MTFPPTSCGSNCTELTVGANGNSSPPEGYVGKPGIEQKQNVDAGGVERRSNVCFLICFEKVKKMQIREKKPTKLLRASVLSLSGSKAQSHFLFPL